MMVNNSNQLYNNYFGSCDWSSGWSSHEVFRDFEYKNTEGPFNFEFTTFGSKHAVQEDMIR